MDQYFKKIEKCSLCESPRNKILISRPFNDPSVKTFLDDYYNNSIEDKYLEGVNYEIAECLNCGFIWQVYILNDELMGNLYDDWIDKKDSLRGKKEADISLFHDYSQEMIIISKLLRKKPFQTSVLDFGMGWGYWCLMAKAFGYNSFGLEFSKSRVDYARNMGINVIDDISKIEDSKIDFINFNHCLEHIEDFKNILNILSSKLSDGGIIRISVPSRRGLKKEDFNSNWKATKNAIHPLEHINSFSHKNLIKLGEIVGLKKISPPFLLSGLSIREIIKRIIKNFYFNNFGTTIYFRKIV